MIIFFTQRPQRAQRFIPFPISRLRWSGRKLRYDKSAQRVLSTPSPLRGTPACLRGRKWVMVLVSCNYSVRASHWGVLPSQGTDGHSVHLLKTLFAPCGRAGEGSILQKLYIPPYPVQGVEILVSSRLGPRMKSAVNMNSQAHDNMSAPPRQNDGDDGCSKCTDNPPILII